MIQLRKLVSGLLSISTALTLSGAGLATAYAAPLTETQVQMSDVRSTLSSNYTITFKVAQTTNVKAIKLQFANTPSGAVTVPTNLSTTGGGVTLASIDVNGTPESHTMDNSTNGLLILSDATGTGGLSAGDLFTVVINGITNTDATTSGGNQCDSVSDSETCYLRISTYNDNSTLNGSTLIDQSVGTFTTISPIVVSATVDPSLTFTVTGISSGSVNGNDSNASCTNNVTTTATTIPFGNIAVNTAKCGQQSLAVATNALNGYKVYHKFIGAAANANMMQGAISSSNNLDPYTGTFGTPTSWTTAPSGTASNANTGWLGMRVVNPVGMSPGIGGFSGANLYAGPAVNNTATLGNAVMDSSGADLGTAVTYVTFKLRTNALQPADTYSGTMVYNVLAKF